MQSRLEQGKLYLQQKKYDLAIRQFQAAIDSGAEGDQVHFELGKTYYILNNNFLSVKELKEAIRLNPENSQARFFLALAYRRQGENELAIRELKIVSQIGFPDRQLHRELGRIFKEERLYDLAIKEYELGLKDDPVDRTLLDLLQLYNFQGQYDKVQEAAFPILKNEFWHKPFLKNSLLNEVEISQRKTILSSKPRILLVTLTNRCNLDCFMCGRGRLDWELSPDIIREISSLFPYLELVTWQGGEVFLASSFDRLFYETFGFDQLNQIIITNGLLITEAWAYRLASRNNVGLTISIDSVDKNTYESIRRGGSFERLTRNLKMLNEARKRYSSNMTLSLRCTIMKANYDQLERFMEFARDYAFDVVQMAPLSSDPFDSQNIFLHRDDKIIHYVSETLPKIRELAKRYKIKLLDWLPTQMVSGKPGGKGGPAGDITEPPQRERPVCFRPWKQLAMNVKGDIFPECLCSSPIGDIFNDSLEEVWNNARMQEYRRKLLRNTFTDWCRSDCSCGAIPPEHLKFTFV
jgi:MoaA/NifB/PqqE/SkfB family radical SAM enzyme